MWGSKTKQSTTSDFFKGMNIFEKMANSLFGKIHHTLNELFSPADIKEYVLPRVIVIGNESTGKSSILENITKCQLFPRDSKLCTKCPICVKLNTGSSFYSITYPDGKKQTVDNKNQIYGHVQKYMNDIPGDTILDTEIIIEIIDNDMPVFEFYDLPGIRTYPPETAKTTTDLCRKYLNERNSIVLCVVPATTTRLTSCQSIALISEMGMEQNCILALTMADRLQPENIEELLIKRILKTSDEINYLNFAGYIAVMNRIHSDKHSLSNHDIIEQRWFQKNILLNIPDEYKKHTSEIEDNVSIVKLISKMDELYNKYIQSEWKPRILNSIQGKLDILNLKYKDLGIDITENNYKEIIEFIHNKIHGNQNDNESVMVTLNHIAQSKRISYDISAKSYHKSHDLINEYINLQDFEYFKNAIDESINDNNIYKLKRLSFLKNKIIDTYSNIYTNLKEQKLQIIETDFKSIIMHMLTRILQLSKHENHLGKLFELHIMSFMTGEMCLPELQLDTLLKFEDFVENDDYKQKRIDLNKLIEKTSDHYKKLNSI